MLFKCVCPAKNDVHQLIIIVKALSLCKILQMRYLIIFLLLLTPALAETCAAQGYVQSDSVKYVVTKNDGTRFIGYILLNDEREVIMETDKLGRVAIPKHEIRSIEPVSKHNGNISEDENRLYTRHFLTTTAMPMKKENNYLHTTWFGLWEAEFALGKNFSLGAMTTYLGIPMAITPKIGFKVAENFHLGAGAIVGTLGWIRFRSGAGLAYGVGTVGNTDYNVSLAAGYGFAWDQGTLSNYESVILAIGANARLGKRFGFVFDSILLPNENFYLLLPGIRWFKRPGAYWSFGFGGLVYGSTDPNGNITYNSTPFPIPMLQYTLFLRD